MTPGFAFILFQAVVITPFCLGLWLRRRIAEPDKFTSRLLRLNIILIEPLIVIWCVWGLELSRNVALMPVAGLGLAVSGLVFGGMVVPLIGTSRRHAIPFLLAATLSNHGFTMGGFFCYLFFGEQGLGLSVIMVLYFIPYLYGCVFPWVKAVTHKRRASALRDYILDTRNMPLFALAAACCLRVIGIPRPDAAFPLDILLALSIALYYLTVGIQYLPSGRHAPVRLHAALAAIKFILVPASAAWFLRFVPLEQTMKSVVLLQSFMPAAVYSVVTSVLFGLDAALASSLFVVNTAVFLCGVLPVVWIMQ